MRELRIRVQLSGSEWEATSSELRQTDLVTISELTERFGISPMTLHRWRRDQRVNFPKEIRVGRLVRFSARQIEQWLNDQAASGRAALERSEG
ncbi:helix-turn-helix transcriptional regulator [Agrobacterium sp. 22-221-1]